VGLFTPFQKKLLRQPDEHPGFQIGQRAGRWLDAQFERVGNFLNAWQYRAGLRRRNYIVLGVLLMLLAYFIYDLLTLF
jgi:hypothetical protein